MTAPTPKNPDECVPSCFCPSGPYANIAFECDNPCPEGCTWEGCSKGCRCNRYYGVVGMFNYTAIMSARPGCLFSEPCGSSSTNIWTVPVYFRGDFDDDDDLGPFYDLRPSELIGPFPIDCQYYCSPCADNSSAIRIRGFRSDGVTSTLAYLKPGFMFEGTWFRTKSFYCTVFNYLPGEFVDTFVTGENEVEVAQKMSAFERAVIDGDDLSDFPSYLS